MSQGGPGKTRRQRGEGSVFEFRPGLWAADLNLGYVNGKRKRQRVYAKTQAEAVKKLNRLKKDRDSGVLSERMTVETWATYWLDKVAAPRLKPTTLATYRSVTNNYIVPVLGKRRLDRLEQQHVRELHAYVAGLARQRDGKPLSAGMPRNVHGVLANMLGDAVREGKLARNVAQLVHAPQTGPGKRGALTAEQAVAVMRAAAEDRLASRWMAAFLLGARQGECLGLQWDFVDLDRGLVDVAWSLQRIPWRHGCVKPCGKKRSASCPDRVLDVPHGFEYDRIEGNLCLIRPKTAGSKRVIPLAPPLAAALRVRRKVAEPSRFVWCRSDGGPLDPRKDRDRWAELLVEAKVPKVVLHEARHTAATLMLELGYDAKVIGQILGHTQMLTTRSYQHVPQDLTLAALTALGDMLAIEPSGT